MRVALLHHWFVTRGGGERVAECMAALLPSADLFSLLCRRSTLPHTLEHRKIHTSLLSAIPGATHVHRHLMPLYPLASRSLNLRDYDFILSSDSGPIKGARKRPGAFHVCYCHSPMRYLYDGYDAYQRGMSAPVRSLFQLTAPRVRRFDQHATGGVDAFISNSFYVAERIGRLYHRDSTVIYPPINMSHARQNTPEDHYLCAGRLVGYKRTEMMIMVCENLGRKLRIAGTGPEMRKLKALAGPNTTFLGELSNEQLWDEYSRCRALLFAADEDFGMVPLEVQACGRPVIAFGFGGSLETVRGENPTTRYAPPSAEWDELARTHPTGMYFSPQTPQAMRSAVLQFEAEEDRFHPETARAFAAGFDTPVFLSALRGFLLDTVPNLGPELASVDAAMATLAQAPAGD